MVLEVKHQSQIDMKTMQKANPKLSRKRHEPTTYFETDINLIWSRIWRPFGIEQLIQIDIDFEKIVKQLQTSIARF